MKGILVADTVKGIWAIEREPHSGAEVILLWVGKDGQHVLR